MTSKRSGKSMSPAPGKKAGGKPKNAKHEFYGKCRPGPTVPRGTSYFRARNSVARAIARARASGCGPTVAPQPVGLGRRLRRPRSEGPPAACSRFWRARSAQGRPRTAERTWGPPGLRPGASGRSGCRTAIAPFDQPLTWIPHGIDILPCRESAQGAYHQARHPCRNAFHVEHRRLYLPMQKREKIAPSKSSELTAPVMRPSECCASLRSSAINSKA
jgi:hypothetical protein